MNCPACSAALEAGATWCPTCGAIVPPPTPAAGPPPAPAPAPTPKPADPVRSAANKAIFSALLAPCCGLVGLLSGFFAIRAIQLARQAKRSVPTRAGIALGLSVLSGLLWIYLVVSFSLHQRELRQKQEAVQQRLAGKREAATLEPGAACDLVEEQLRAGLYEGWLADGVTCHGPLDAHPDRAMLKGVEMDYGITRVRLNACLARAQRWFVYRVTSSDTCPRPPAPGSGDTPEAQEEAARREATVQGDHDDVANFLGTLVRAKEVVTASQRTERSCPPIDFTSFGSAKKPDHLRLRTVDLALLDFRAGVPIRAEWKFLTSDEMRTALDAGASTRERAAAVHRIGLDGGPYVVVYQGLKAEWPHLQQDLSDDDPTVWGGRWAGWMVVADLRNGQPVCQTFLAVEMPAEREGSAKKRLAKTLKELKEQFEDEATERMKAMSERRLRLGYKLLE